MPERHVVHARTSDVCGMATLARLCALSLFILGYHVAHHDRALHDRDSLDFCPECLTNLYTFHTLVTGLRGYGRFGHYGRFYRRLLEL